MTDLYNTDIFDDSFGTVFDMMPISDKVEYVELGPFANGNRVRNFSFLKNYFSQTPAQIIKVIESYVNKNTSKALSQVRKSTDDLPILCYELMSSHHIRKTILMKSQFGAMPRGNFTLSDIPILEMSILKPYSKSREIRFDNNEDFDIAPVRPIVLQYCHSSSGDHLIGKFFIWLVKLADRLADDLSVFEAMQDDDRVLCANVGWALASTLSSPRLLELFCCIEPRLLSYLYGKNLSAKDDFESIQGRGLVLDRGIVLSASDIVNQASWMINSHLSDADSPIVSNEDSLSAIKKSYDSLSLAISSTKQRKFHSLCQIVLELSEPVADAVKTFWSEYEIDLSRVNRVVGTLVDFRNALLNSYEEPCFRLHDQLAILLNELEAIQKSYNSIVKFSKQVILDINLMESGKLSGKQLLSHSRMINDDIGQISDEVQRIEEDLVVLKQLAVFDLDSWLLPANEVEPSTDGIDGDKSITATPDVAEEISILRHGNEELQDELQLQVERNSELHDTVRLLKYQLSVSSANPSEKPEAAENIPITAASDFEGYSVLETLQMLGETFSDRLRILPSVYESIGTLSLKHKGPTIARYLIALATEGIDIIRDGRPMIEMRDVIPGTLSCNESETVRKMAALRKYRTFKDGNSKRIMYPHINIDYRDRLYFDYAQDEDRIVIGYLGQHLPVSSLG